MYGRLRPDSVIFPAASTRVLSPGCRELEPVEAVTGQGEQVTELPDRREDDPAHALHRGDPPESPQVEFDRLREPRQVVDAQDAVRDVHPLRPVTGPVVGPDERQ